MIEILGAELDKVFEELKISAKKTYELKNKSWEYCEIYQVWEISDEDFIKLCSMTEDEWKDDWGWWRSSEGSNMGSVNHRYNINNHYIYAWDGYSREEFELENKKLSSNDKWFRDRKYKNLLEYLCDEIGVSTEKNVTAVAIDLAKQNNISMGELFKKYQG